MGIWLKESSRLCGGGRRIGFQGMKGRVGRHSNLTHLQIPLLGKQLSKDFEVTAVVLDVSVDGYYTRSTVSDTNRSS